MQVRQKLRWLLEVLLLLLNLGCGTSAANLQAPLCWCCCLLLL
jgi:hypothetical protein